MLRKVLDRENVVKSNLMKRLVDCVKELQFKYATDKGATLVNDETTNLLCWILEAVFIHGLKSTFLKSVTSVFQTRDTSPPEPSFWEFVLIFCHQEVIVSINQLSYISSDVGRCRAWLRLALNDGLLISYIQMMLKDKNLVKDYYKPNAFLRDSEMCDMLKSYLYGIESYNFQLACNSSLLNTWNSGPLSLVGLWTNPYESVTQGIDVAENMDSRDLQVIPQLRSGRSSPVIQTPPYVVSLRPSLLDEDAALRMILKSKSSPSSRPGSGHSSVCSTPPTEQILASYQPVQPSDFNSNHQVDARLGRASDMPILPDNTTDAPKTSVSTSSPVESFLADARTQRHEPVFGFEEPERAAIELEVSNSCESTAALIESHAVSTPIHVGAPSREVEVLENRTGEEASSYNAVLETYREPVGTPITDSFLESVFRKDSIIIEEEGNRSGTPVSQLERMGFEVVVAPASMRMSQMQSFLERIPREIGLDEQDYKCKYCERAIGMIYGPARLCALTGHHFCFDCHGNDESVIPSRIIFNWDFNKYYVSKRAKELMQESVDTPMFDISALNKSIYKEIGEFEEVKIQRQKLKSIILYLKTCKEAESLYAGARDFWPREHLVEDEHLYSIADLLGVPNRSLSTSLAKLVVFGQSHIKHCSVCRQKGFICEVCKDPKVLFPFNIETVYKCSSCGAVFHSSCQNYKKPCPRCLRWKTTSTADSLAAYL